MTGIGRLGLVVRWVGLVLLSLGVLATVILLVWVNPLSAALALAAEAFYLLVYTVWLKRRTTQNIVWGGLAGCFPALIGWTAVTNEVAWPPVVLFMVVFFWTPPHFWALSLYISTDYAKAGVPMLPVVKGAKETRRQILIYTLALIPVCIAPVFTGLGGWLYLAVSGLGGLVFLTLAWRVFTSTAGDAADPRPADRDLYEVGEAAAAKRETDEMDAVGDSLRSLDGFEGLRTSQLI